MLGHGPKMLLLTVLDALGPPHLYGGPSHARE